MGLWCQFPTRGSQALPTPKHGIASTACVENRMALTKRSMTSGIQVWFAVRVQAAFQDIQGTPINPNNLELL